LSSRARPVRSADPSDVDPTREDDVMTGLERAPTSDAFATLRPPEGDREEGAFAAVLEVASASGLDVAGAGIWRSGSAVLVGLPGARVLGRVDAAARRDSARRQVIVSEVLADLGVATITVTGPYEQPVVSPAGAVTLWVWLDVLAGVEIDPRGLGQVARRLHDATRGGVPDVPAFDLLAAIAAELDRAEAEERTAPGDLLLLRERAAGLADEWPHPEDDPLGVAVVHGDLHRHNVLATSGGPVLADLELAGVGPVCADIVPHVVAIRRYGAPPHVLDDFLAGYGLEAGGWSGFEVLVQAYEMWVTAWAVANRGVSKVLDDEAEVRLDRWRPGHRFPRPWSLH
jgi:hypothetical protein